MTLTRWAPLLAGAGLFLAACSPSLPSEVNGSQKGPSVLEKAKNALVPKSEKTAYDEFLADSKINPQFIRKGLEILSSSPEWDECENPLPNYRSPDVRWGKSAVVSGDVPIYFFEAKCYRVDDNHRHSSVGLIFLQNEQTGKWQSMTFENPSSVLPTGQFSNDMPDFVFTTSELNYSAVQLRVWMYDGDQYQLSDFEIFYDGEIESNSNFEYKVHSDA